MFIFTMPKNETPINQGLFVGHKAWHTLCAEANLTVNSDYAAKA